jgi:mannose-6-phosphate isomerase-like protein (cupin superfamily)
MTAGKVVTAAAIAASEAGPGTSTRVLIDAGLTRRLIDFAAEGMVEGSAGADELWFVLEGTGQLAAGGEAPVELRQDRAVLLPAGMTYRVTAGAGTGLRLDAVTLPASGGAGGPAPGGTVDPLPAWTPPATRDFADCPVETTGDRQFRVLFGPARGCSVATQFVGEIPPGRAPEHSHPYDEVVLVLAGEGVAHIGGAEHSLAPGTCAHLPPGLPHCLENTGQDTLRVLGVFHPADSPAAKLPGPS